MFIDFGSRPIHAQFSGTA